MKIPKIQFTKIIKAIVTDTVLIVGLGGVSYGLFEIYSPLAPIFVGSFMIYLVLPTKKAKTPKKR